MKINQIKRPRLKPELNNLNMSSAIPNEYKTFKMNPKLSIPTPAKLQSFHNIYQKNQKKLDVSFGLPLLKPSSKQQLGCSTSSISNNSNRWKQETPNFKSGTLPKNLNFLESNPEKNYKIFENQASPGQKIRSNGYLKKQFSRKKLLELNKFHHPAHTIDQYSFSDHQVFLTSEPNIQQKDTIESGSAAFEQLKSIKNHQKFKNGQIVEFEKQVVQTCGCSKCCTGAGICNGRMFSGCNMDQCYV